MEASFERAVLLSLVTSQFVVLTTADCWWTGCQPSAWEVTGCEQYDRIQGDFAACEDGFKYNCCEREFLSGCWWTGCQPSAWEVTGCEQYDRIQTGTEACEDGLRYHCCERDSLESHQTEAPSSTVQADSECWWTGCQLSVWEVTGCEQYNTTQRDIESCVDGHKFLCCPGGSTQSTPRGPYTNCMWSECQHPDWSDRGCPSDTIQVSSQSCGKEEGDTFQCCETMQNTTDDDDVNLISGESFQNLVKSLLLRGKNFTIEPDSLPCLDVDTEKQAILRIKNEGIYICDLCPYFPQKRFVNVYLSNIPSEIEYNLKFQECFGFCFDKKDCVALSYDYSEHICYIFNNTVGNFIQDAYWTTVFMTQPTGVIQDWTYSRHTAITGQVLSSSQEASFQTCLKRCEEINGCSYVSFVLEEGECLMFSAQEHIKYIDLRYGFISGFKISSMTGMEVTARFIEVGDDIFKGSEILRRSKDVCNSDETKTHSAFFSKSCFTSPGLGCDIVTGCKKCYYPENTNDRYNLVICPDSTWIVYDEIKKYIRSSLRNCLDNPFCIAVGYNSNTKETTQLTFDSFMSDDFTTMFILRYPVTNSSNREIVSKFEFLFNYDIERIGHGSGGFEQVNVKSFQTCFKMFESRKSFRRMSFADGICKMSSEEVKYVLRSGNSISVLKKPDITSPVLNYLITPGISVNIDKAKQVLSSCSNCDVDCAKKCSEDFKGWCSHFMTKISSESASCYFFDFFKDTQAQRTELIKDENSQLFTKLSGLDFTLKSLNDLNPFQSSDIQQCFQPDSENQQTSISLTNYEWKNNDNTALGLRGKRDAWDWLVGTAKAVVGGFVDTVKSSVEAVVDTAVGVVNTVKNVVQGDFEKAKESFVNIPIVRDVKTVVDVGKAVVAGDWDEVREKGSELLQSHIMDVATSVIPVAGKFLGRGLKVLGKAIKKSGGRVKRSAKRNIDNVNKNNKKVKENNKGNDISRSNCKKRNKRAKGKRRRPGDCDDDDDDDDDEDLCPRPRIMNVIETTMSGCKNRQRNAKCEFECDPGYDEPDRDVKCLGRRNQRLQWKPTPTCERINCGPTFYPFISLQTPHITKAGYKVFGKYITIYTVVFNKERKLPEYTVALHQSTQFKSKDYTATKNLKRKNEFKPFPCAELVGHQAKPSDYTGSGWDQGHLTPANVARWSEKARLSSNLFINVAPQDVYTNRGPWSNIENVVECFSKDVRSLVATGVCRRSIGKTKVTGVDIPACFWKMVCYKDENGKEQVVGFFAPNTHPLDKNKRREEVLTPRSQNEIRQELQELNIYTFRSPWLTAGASVNTGRPIMGARRSLVWYPVNRFDCEKAGDLSQVEKEAWIESLSKLNKKGKKGRRSKRDSNIKIKRGCHSLSEIRNMNSLLGINADHGDDDVDVEQDASLLEDGGEALVGVQKCNKRIIGYYTSWGEKRISGRELKRLTHVVYAFLEMKEDGSIDIGSADRSHAVNIDEEVKKSRDRLTNLMELANLYPHVKVMFAVGGWENSQYFSAVAADPSKRITFISSIVKMIQKYGFDGVDIDWEYPVTGGANEGIPQDKQNYVNLMKEIRSTLDALADKVGRTEKFFISFAGAAGQWTLDPGFDLPGLLKYADFVNIMTYDYFGAWASKWGAYTGPPAPLYFGMPARFSGKTNVDWTVKYYTCKTKLPHKINMGVPFYGRYWENVGDPVDGKDGMWRTANPIDGKFEGGYVAWSNISEFLDKGGFEENFHEKSKTPYAWNPGRKTFLGYENEKSLGFKVEHAVKKNVGGLMIWSIELDDDDLSLLNTVYRASLCDKTNPKEINHKCPPIDEKRWWTAEDSEEVAGLCGRSAPLYKGYYPVCDPDDPGYSCCGPAGYCGAGDKYCDCPTCKNYGEYPEKILDQPIKPSVPVSWYFLNAEDGKRGRCGRQIPKIRDVFPTCNPDDDNAFCCSNGGYCGSGKEHCECNGCVDFRKNKTYRYGPKKWWDSSDGVDKAGKCGPTAPKVDGVHEAECEPNTKFNCCSGSGYCGSGPDFCDCAGCKRFT